jgi:hypothetical protein
MKVRAQAFSLWSFQFIAMAEPATNQGRLRDTYIDKVERQSKGGVDFAAIL